MNEKKKLLLIEWFQNGNLLSWGIFMDTFTDPNTKC